MWKNFEDELKRSATLALPHGQGSKFQRISKQDKSAKFALSFTSPSPKREELCCWLVFYSSPSSSDHVGSFSWHCHFHPLTFNATLLYCAARKMDEKQLVIGTRGVSQGTSSSRRHDKTAADENIIWNKSAILSLTTSGVEKVFHQNGLFEGLITHLYLWVMGSW